MRIIIQLNLTFYLEDIMKLSDHYLRLIEEISKKQVQISHKVTIQQISELLCFTQRHTKHILKQLAEKNWIKWDVSSGRGNKSSLTFLITQEELKVEIAKFFVEKGHYQKALDEIEMVNTNHKMEFHNWLNKQLGFSTEKRNDTELDILRYPFYKCIKNLDPAHVISRHDGHIVSHIFDTLVKFDSKENVLIPHLASHWETNDRGKTWTFYLRKGIRFHHGRELTAEDVQHTINRLQTLDEPYQDANVFKTITTVKVLRKTVVQFVLNEENYLFPYYLSHYQTNIIPLEIIHDDTKNFSTYPIGSGPFKIVKHDDTMLVLEAFDLYFKHRPHLDRVEILTLPNLYPNQNELINHWFNLGSPDQKENWQKINKTEEGASYLTLNLNKEGLLQKKTFREALSKALDIKNIANDLGHASYFPAYSFLTSESEKLDEDIYDLEKAVELLRETGYNGEVLQIFSTQLRPGANLEEEAQWIQKQWKRIGVNSEVKIIPIEELAKDQILKKADVIIAGIALSENTLLSLMKTYQTSTAFISNMVGPILLRDIQETLRQVQSQKLSQNLLDAFMNLECKLKDEYALFFLHHRSHSVFVNVGSSLEGVELSSYGRIDYRKLWFKIEEEIVD